MSTERPVIAQVDERPEYRGRSTDARTTPPSRLHFGVHVPPCTCLLNRPEACQRHPVGDCGCAVCAVARRAQAGARASEGAAEGEAPRGWPREMLQAARHYDERHMLTIPAQPAAECGHTTPRRWHTATCEWCDDCYMLAFRVFGGRP